jgi:SAM-dependent methyltransferase
MPCPLCGSSRAKGDRVILGPFYRCACGLVINGDIAAEDYGEDYFTGDDGGPGHRDFDSAGARAYDLVRFGRELALIGAPPPNGRLLDVGSATGSFLALAQQRGWTALGVEISQAARDRSQTKGAQAVATLAEASSSAPYAVVTMHHVVEHLEDPVATLRDVRALIEPEGLLVVEVPNFASWDRHAAGAGWLDLRPDQHRWQFDPGRLRRLLASSGFRTVKVTTLGEPIPTRRSVVQSLGIPLPRRRRAAPPTDRDPPVDVDSFEPAWALRAGATIADGITTVVRRGKRLLAMARPDGVL